MVSAVHRKLCIEGGGGRTWQAQLVSSQNLNFQAGGGEEQSGNIRKLKSLHHHNRDTWNKYSMESFKGIVS